MITRPPPKAATRLVQHPHPTAATKVRNLSIGKQQRERPATKQDSLTDAGCTFAICAHRNLPRIQRALWRLRVGGVASRSETAADVNVWRKARGSPLRFWVRKKWDGWMWMWRRARLPADLLPSQAARRFVGDEALSNYPCHTMVIRCASPSPTTM